MKRSLILIAALFSILCCWAEDSKTPTVDILTIDATAKYGPKMWSMYYENDEGAREMDAVFEVGKDSTLNGQRYLKIIINAASYVETERDTLLYRQENGKVFFVPKGEKKEILLLNYDLEVNDVFVYPDFTDIPRHPHRHLRTANPHRPVHLLLRNRAVKLQLQTV